MAKLARFELDAVIDTVISQINEKKVDSPEQLEYLRLCELREVLNKEIKERNKVIKEILITEFTAKSEGLTISDDYYYRIFIDKPNAPLSTINKTLIERELIVANISGNIEETIEKIVTKYTK